MQSHFNALIAIFVVHIVDNVQGVDIKPCKPIHNAVVFSDNLIIFEIFGGNRSNFRGDLIAVFFVLAAVYCVKQSLCKVCTSAEELHLLADSHCGNTAGDSIVVAEFFSHKVVAFILN